ncbi:MAG: hypothetical protein JST59_00995 [Actinobacteria bacterium]|nr:hypothetical protein [Actinomycetota bacterium]
MYFAKSVPFAHTRNRYYIITNYRFIFCTDSLHKRVIKYYSIKRLILEGRVLIIELVIPERKSYFLFTVKHHHFKFKFDSERLAADITERLDKAIRANVPRSDLQEPVLGTIAAIL